MDEQQQQDRIRKLELRIAQCQQQHTADIAALNRRLIERDQGHDKQLAALRKERDDKNNECFDLLMHGRNLVKAVYAYRAALLDGAENATRQKIAEADALAEMALTSFLRSYPDKKPV